MRTFENLVADTLASRGVAPDTTRMGAQAAGLRARQESDDWYEQQAVAAIQRQAENQSRRDLALQERSPRVDSIKANWGGMQALADNIRGATQSGRSGNTYSGQEIEDIRNRAIGLQAENQGLSNVEALRMAMLQHVATHRKTNSSREGLMGDIGLVYDRYAPVDSTGMPIPSSTFPLENAFDQKGTAQMDLILREMLASGIQPDTLGHFRQQMPAPGLGAFGSNSKPGNVIGQMNAEEIQERGRNMVLSGLSKGLRDMITEARKGKDRPQGELPQATGADPFPGLSDRMAQEDAAIFERMQRAQMPLNKLVSAGSRGIEGGESPVFHSGFDVGRFYNPPPKSAEDAILQREAPAAPARADSSAMQRDSVSVPVDSVAAVTTQGAIGDGALAGGSVIQEPVPSPAADPTAPQAVPQAPAARPPVALPQDTPRPRAAEIARPRPAAPQAPRNTGAQPSPEQIQFVQQMVLEQSGRMISPEEAMEILFAQAAPQTPSRMSPQQMAERIIQQGPMPY